MAQTNVQAPKPVPAPKVVKNVVSGSNLGPSVTKGGK